MLPRTFLLKTVRSNQNLVKSRANQNLAKSRFQSPIKRTARSSLRMRTQAAKSLASIRLAIFVTGFTSKPVDLNACVDAEANKSCPEDDAFSLHDILHRIVFVCDNEARSVQWIRSNNVVAPEHFFSDLKMLAREFKDFDVIGELARLIELPREEVIHYFFASISCRGYSFGRTGRQLSWADHPDTYMIEAFLVLLMAVKPHRAGLENAWGFLKRDTQGNGTPLHRFLHRCVQFDVHNFFNIIIFLVPGDTWHVWHRRRIITSFFLKEANSEESIDLCIKMTEDHSNVISLVPTVVILAVLNRFD